MSHRGARNSTTQLVGLGCVLLVALSSGCRMTRTGSLFGMVGSTAPAVLQPTATAAEVVAAVNQNTARIQSYTAPNASFSTPGMPGLPMLRGNIVLERPRRFRLRAGTALTGSEVDLGSNDQLFWLWAKRNEPPAVYFARHDQHATGAARMLLPIDPSWVVDALGLVTLDPAAAYQGPFPRADGALELRHTVTGPNGPTQRVTVVDPTRAWVVEQHAYDQTGTLVASAIAEDFRFDPVQQVSLPERVTIRVPNADLALTINTGTVAINTPIVNPGQQWSLPNLEGYPQVDLGQSDGIPGVAVAPAAALSTMPPVYSPPTIQPSPAIQQPQAVLPSAASTATFRTTQRLPAGGIELPAFRTRQ
ncbi:MAG: hypothetical protein AAGF31_08910 [Planctomycetota bacterium]